MNKTAFFKWTLASACALLLVACATGPDEATTRQIGEKIVKESFTAPSPNLLKRLDQDRSQQICSKIAGAQLTQQEAAEVVKLARESIKYPASGKLVGDWKLGDKLAHDGAGDRIARGKLEKRKENGGLCQNCHALAPGENRLTLQRLGEFGVCRKGRRRENDGERRNYAQRDCASW